MLGLSIGKDPWLMFHSYSQPINKISQHPTLCPERSWVLCKQQITNYNKFLSLWNLKMSNINKILYLIRLILRSTKNQYKAGAEDRECHM